MKNCYIVLTGSYLYQSYLLYFIGVLASHENKQSKFLCDSKHPVNDQKSGQKNTWKKSYFLGENCDGKNGHRMKLPVKTAPRYNNMYYYMKMCKKMELFIAITIQPLNAPLYKNAMTLVLILLWNWYSRYYGYFNPSENYS